MTKDSMPDLDFHGKALDNIFEDYEERLQKCPVGHSDKYGGFKYIAKYEDIFAAEQDPETWSVAPTMLLPSFGTDRPMIPIDIDPPEHTAYRKLLLPLLTPAAVEALTPGMHKTAQELIADVKKSLAETGTADASTQFGRPMPTIIFSRLAGFPEEDWPLFDQWVDDIIYERTKDPERARAAGQAVDDYFAALLAKRKGTEPTGDLMSVLEHAKIDGRPLTQDELLSYCYLLFLGGLDTTAWAIRSSLWYLSRNPKAQQQLRDNPGMIPSAAEEFLRTLSPVQSMARTCKKDTVVRGMEIKAGERVVLSFGAGNRDPEIFEDPNEIKLDRERNRHLAFGGGVHRCLGSNLGRRELVVALEEFLANVPEFEAADPDEVWHGVGPLTIRLTK